MGPEDQARLDIARNDSDGWLVRLTVPGHSLLGGKNPYDACKGKVLEEAPLIVARQYGTQPNPHFICSLMACETAAGVVPSEYKALRRSLVLYGIALREHGLHLAGCVRTGMLESGESETAVLCGYAESIAREGQSLAMAYNDGSWQRSRRKDEKGQIVQRLSDVRDAAILLARSFASVRHVLNPTLRISRVAKESVGWAEQGTSLVWLDEGWRRAVHWQAESDERLINAVQYGVPVSVGPLSRLSLAVMWPDWLPKPLPERSVRDIAFALNRLPTRNIFLIPMAIAAECVVLIDRAIEGVAAMPSESGPRSSRDAVETAVAVIEAPRGTLFHEVKAKDGRVVSGRIITPTRLNLTLMQRSLRNALDSHRQVNRESFERQAALILRALYPCMELTDESFQICWHDDNTGR